jgi:hypothetical protein
MINLDLIRAEKNNSILSALSKSMASKSFRRTASGEAILAHGHLDARLPNMVRLRDSRQVSDWNAMGFPIKNTYEQMTRRVRGKQDTEMDMAEDRSGASVSTLQCTYGHLIHLRNSRSSSASIFSAIILHESTLDFTGKVHSWHREYRHSSYICILLMVLITVLHMIKWDALPPFDQILIIKRIQCLRVKNGAARANQ